MRAPLPVFASLPPYIYTHRRRRSARAGTVVSCGCAQCPILNIFSAFLSAIPFARVCTPALLAPRGDGADAAPSRVQLFSNARALSRRCGTFSSSLPITFLFACAFIHILSICCALPRGSSAWRAGTGTVRYLCKNWLCFLHSCIICTRAYVTSSLPASFLSWHCPWLSLFCLLTHSCYVPH